MITLMIMPNFKGTLKDTITAGIVCLCLDAVYIVPILIDCSIL
jgi:hypothetical protein